MEKTMGKQQFSKKEFEIMLEMIIPSGYGIKSFKNIDDENSFYSQIIKNAIFYKYIKSPE